MPTKLTFTMPQDLTDTEIQALRYLFNDALGEFAHTREPVLEYVDRRYREQSSGFRAAKVVEVRARLALVAKLKGPLYNCTVERVADKENK